MGDGSAKEAGREATPEEGTVTGSLSEEDLIDALLDGDDEDDDESAPVDMESQALIAIIVAAQDDPDKFGAKSVKETLEALGMVNYWAHVAEMNKLQ